MKLRPKVLASITMNGPGTLAEIYEDLGGQHSRKAISMCLSRLTEAGVLRRNGCRKGPMGRPAYIFERTNP